MEDNITLPGIGIMTERLAKLDIEGNTLSTLTHSYPEKGDLVVKVGQVISVVWDNFDISTVNIIFYKENQRLYITNKAVIDEKNNYSIFVDNSFFSADFLPCKIRIEMKEDPTLYKDSDIFQVIRK